MKGYKRTIRKYYKYTTTPNATVVGSPTINNGVASGFSTSNYFTYTGAIPNITSFEQVMKIKTGGVTTKQCISAGEPYKGLGSLIITTASKIEGDVSSNGTSNNIMNGATSTLTVQANTDYWLKFHWNGSVYKIDLSTDGENYTTYVSATNSNKPAFSGMVGIGTDTGASNNNPFLGSIDFTQSYIKINGEYWWIGVTSVESTSSDYDYYIDEDVYKLIEYTQSNTNVLTNIPQDINLELNNGTLTLKAGSKIYVPNGFEQDGTTRKFDVVNVDSDMVLSTSWGTATQCSIIYETDNERLQIIALDRLSSGTTAPTATNAQVWYDITNNLVKRYLSGSFENYVSLPIAIVTNVSSGNISSIDQIFNGFGYIGSHIFGLPHVQGLIPNGFNADGSYKTIAFDWETVYLFQVQASKTNYDIRSWATYIGNGGVNYNPSTNYNYNSNNTPVDANIRECIMTGKYTSGSNGKVTALTIPTTVQPSTIPIYKAVNLS